jgi:hypothetical protein
VECDEGVEVHPKIFSSLTMTTTKFGLLIAQAVQLSAEQMKSSLIVGVIRNIPSTNPGLRWFFNEFSNWANSRVQRFGLRELFILATSYSPGSWAGMNSSPGSKYCEPVFVVMAPKIPDAEKEFWSKTLREALFSISSFFETSVWVNSYPVQVASSPAIFSEPSRLIIQDPILAHRPVIIEIKNIPHSVTPEEALERITTAGIELGSIAGMTYHTGGIGYEGLPWICLFFHPNVLAPEIHNTALESLGPEATLSGPNYIPRGHMLRAQGELRRAMSIRYSAFALPDLRWKSSSHRDQSVAAFYHATPPGNKDWLLSMVDGDARFIASIATKADSRKGTAMAKQEPRSYVDAAQDKSRAPQTKIAPAAGGGRATHKPTDIGARARQQLAPYSAEQTVSSNVSSLTTTTHETQKISKQVEALTREIAELKKELASFKTQTEEKLAAVELNSFVDRQELESLGALMRPKPSLGATMDEEVLMQEPLEDLSLREESKTERKLPLHMEKSVSEEILGQFVIPYQWQEIVRVNYEAKRHKAPPEDTEVMELITHYHQMSDSDQRSLPERPVIADHMEDSKLILTFEEVLRAHGLPDRYAELWSCFTTQNIRQMLVNIDVFFTMLERCLTRNPTFAITSAERREGIVIVLSTRITSMKTGNWEAFVKAFMTNHADIETMGIRFAREVYRRYTQGGQSINAIWSTVKKADIAESRQERELLHKELQSMLRTEGKELVVTEFVIRAMERPVGLDYARMVMDDRELLETDFNAYLERHENDIGSEACKATETDKRHPRKAPFWPCACGCLDEVGLGHVKLCVDCGRAMSDGPTCFHKIIGDTTGICRICAPKTAAGEQAVDPTLKRREKHMRYFSQLWELIASNDMVPDEEIGQRVHSWLIKPESELKAFLEAPKEAPGTTSKRKPEGSPGVSPNLRVPEKKTAPTDSAQPLGEKELIKGFEMHPKHPPTIRDLTETRGGVEPTSPFCEMIRDAHVYLQERQFDTGSVNVLIVHSRPYTEAAVRKLTTTTLKQLDTKDAIVALALNSTRNGGSTITWHQNGEGECHIMSKIDNKGANRLINTITEGAIDLILLSRDMYMSVGLVTDFMAENGPYHTLLGSGKIGVGAIILPLYGGSIYEHLRGAWTTIANPMDLALDVHSMIYTSVDSRSNKVTIRENTTKQFDGWVRYIPAKRGTSGNPPPAPRPVGQRTAKSMGPEYRVTSPDTPPGGNRRSSRSPATPKSSSSDDV